MKRQELRNQLKTVATNSQEFTAICKELAKLMYTNKLNPRNKQAK